MGIRDIKAVVFDLYCGRLVSSAATPTSARDLKPFREFCKCPSSPHRVEGKMLDKGLCLIFAPST